MFGDTLEGITLIGLRLPWLAALKVHHTVSRFGLYKSIVLIVGLFLRKRNAPAFRREKKTCMRSTSHARDIQINGKVIDLDQIKAVIVTKENNLLVRW